MAAFTPVELFIADPHGEYEEFSHILRGGCGAVRALVDEVFGKIPEEKRASLTTAILYPKEKFPLLDPEERASFAWRMGMLLEEAADVEFADEEPEDEPDAGENPAAFARLAALVREACVTHLHLMGDIYDRGPAPDAIMDEVAAFGKFDIQWGNHDILWMGAALGQPALVCTATRICARYGNLSILEDNYGMDLSALREFAAKTYGDDPAECFALKSGTFDDAERRAHSLVQKAMAIIQFKVEAKCSAENPDFNLDRRNLLGRIDWQAGTVEVDGTVQPMKDMHFPTVNPADPYALTPEEQAVLDACVAAFTGCAKLQRHVRLFLTKGSLYKIIPSESGADDILLFHACVPLNPDGSLKDVTLFGQTYAGRALFDAVDGFVRDAYTATDPAAKKRGLDMLWYLWLGEGSPLFAKSKMATFELYFQADKAIQKEVKNPFYKLLEDEAVLDGILADFGLDPARSRMICGHTPVKVKDGEDPVKCGGKLMIIDGGMSKPYQKNTGVAGFTVVRATRREADEYGENVRLVPGGMTLYTHETFCGRDMAVATDEDLRSSTRAV